MKVFATYNIKGGVGKTASAVNLSYFASSQGARTLIWDLDPQGSASYYFRVKAKVKGGSKAILRGKRKIDRAIRSTDFERLELLPADFSYRHMDLQLDTRPKPRRRLAQLLQPLEQEFDFVFLDCAPSISLVSESVFRAADALLVPTIPTTLSLRTLDLLERHLARDGERAPRLLPFFCMVDRRKQLHRQICADADVRFLSTQIPYSTVVERMGVQRAPLPTFAPRSAPSIAYRTLWEEICRLNEIGESAGDDPL